MVLSSKTKGGGWAGRHDQLSNNSIVGPNPCWDDEQFIYKINSGGINEDIAGYWVEIAVIASKPYTGHRHTLIKYVSIHK